MYVIFQSQQSFENYIKAQYLTSNINECSTLYVLCVYKANIYDGS